MRGRFGGGSRGLLCFFIAAAIWLSGAYAWAAPCAREVVKGEVHAGEPFVRPIGRGLEVMLEPLASGWILRVLPVSGARPAHDYAELATPPYESVSPLLISTDYSFRAQDVIAWNPREFRYAADAREYGQMLRLYGAFQHGDTAAAGGLAKLAGQAPEGTLTIVDARLVPGTADQAGTAAGVAVHYGTTAHTLERPADGKATALGKVTWMRFRIELELPAGSFAERGMKMERQLCR